MPNFQIAMETIATITLTEVPDAEAARHHGRKEMQQRSETTIQRTNPPADASQRSISQNRLSISAEHDVRQNSSEHP